MNHKTRLNQLEQAHQQRNGFVVVYTSDDVRYWQHEEGKPTHPNDNAPPEGVRALSRADVGTLGAGNRKARAKSARDLQVG